ncbi:TPA: manganese catalase family protein, partial [Clostridioides difficile]|nr:manganese catalase family protein [Clostridioides difficile]
SNRDFGVTEDSKLYFDLSTPGPNHDTKIDINPPSFEKPLKK